MNKCVKNLFLFLMITVLAVGFTACGGASEQNGAEKTVETFINALADFDSETAKSCLKNGETSSIILDGRNYNKESMVQSYVDVGISEETADKIMDLVAETNKKAITFKITDTKDNGKKTTVTVAFSVKDPADLWDEILISNEVLEAYGSNDQGMAVLKSYELLSEKLEKATPASVNVKFTLEKADDKWVISEMDENISKVY